MNREQWLEKAARRLERELLSAHGARLPERWKVSVGFPYGSRKAIGQCWDPAASSDEATTTVFISPVLHGDEPGAVVQLLATLLHELVHAAVGNREKHGGEFKRVARAVGLQGRLTATYAAEGTELHGALLGIGEALGLYPHVAVNPRAALPGRRGKDGAGGDEEGEGEGKGGGGWIRLRSRSNPKYSVVISPKQLEENGPPVDPWGEAMAPADGA